MPEPKSITIERSGIDANGNRFFQQQVVSSQVQPLTIYQNADEQQDYYDYYEQQEEEKSVDQLLAERAFLAALNMAMNLKDNKEKFEAQYGDSNDGTPSVQEQLNLIAKLESPIKSKRMQLLSSESAIDFGLNPVHGLGPYHLVPETGVEDLAQEKEELKKEFAEEMEIQKENQEEAQSSSEKRDETQQLQETEEDDDEELEVKKPGKNTKNDRFV